MQTYKNIFGRFDIVSGVFRLLTRVGCMEMGDRATLMQIWGSRWRAYKSRALPLASAMIFHLLLLVMIASWKPPPIGQLARPIEVSLVSGRGMAADAFAPTVAQPAPVEAKPTPLSAKSPVAIETAAKLTTTVVPNPKQERSKSVPPLWADIAKSGPSLTAEPVSISTSPMQTIPVAAQMAGDKNCQILETLKIALQASGEVKAALSLVPTKSMSVSKAIVLWDGRWIDAQSVGGLADLTPIEQAVAEIVMSAPANCRLEAINGVRFITLGDARDTTVLAFGSNNWHWTDVVATLSPTSSK